MPEQHTPEALILYGAPHCHLCDLAEEIVAACCAQWPALTYRKVDISEDAQLLKRYALRIPVLRLAGGRELGWPFSSEDLGAALGAEAG
jgi:hypothetical protein